MNKKIRIVGSLRDVEKSLDPDDQFFINKVKKNYGEKEAKEILKEMDGTYRKGPSKKFGRNFFKKD